ncbi:MAG: hypothetical protein Q8R55_05955 [Candidatus Taylorbacteria bacterium]|nr:hypothetical protein [Candidatus Taylorbacteria bacterium]
MIGHIAEPPVDFCAEINAFVSKHDEAAPIEFETKAVPSIDYRKLSEIFESTGSTKDFSGRPFYLPRQKVNTDELIPAEYLTEVDKKSFGAHLLEGIVVDPEERKVLEHSKIIVSDIGFGDGSSREQAPWALEGAGIGINCVIAKSFERIFETNFVNTGNLPVTLPTEIVDELFKKRPDYIKVVWDTLGDESGYIEWRENKRYKKATFELSGFLKTIIRKGGSTGVMLKLATELQAEGKI